MQVAWLDILSLKRQLLQVACLDALPSEGQLLDVVASEGAALSMLRARRPEARLYLRMRGAA